MRGRRRGRRSLCFLLLLRSRFRVVSAACAAPASSLPVVFELDAERCRPAWPRLAHRSSPFYFALFPLPCRCGRSQYSLFPWCANRNKKNDRERVKWAEPHIAASLFSSALQGFRLCLLLVHAPGRLMQIAAGVLLARRPVSVYSFILRTTSFALAFALLIGSAPRLAHALHFAAGVSAALPCDEDTFRAFAVTLRRQRRASPRVCVGVADRA